MKLFVAPGSLLALLLSSLSFAPASGNVFEEGSSSSSVLGSLRLYDLLRSQATDVTRDKDSNIDKFTAGGHHIPLCHLAALFPFTTGNKEAYSYTFESAVGVALAAQHLNTGDGSISSAVESLHERCPIRFTTEFADTEYSGGIALGHVAEITGRELPGGRLPCAFLGAVRSSVSMPTSIVTGLLGYPQISDSSTSPDLDDKSQFPLFGRTVPSDAGGAIPIIRYLYNELKIRHLAAININDSYGNNYIESMRLAAAIHAPDMVIHQIPLDEDSASIKAVVESLKTSEFRFVFTVIFTREVHDALLEEAYNQGVAGTGLHQWLYGDSFAGTLEGRTFPKDSPLHHAYRGSGLLEVSGGLPGLPAYDRYAEAIAKIKNPTDLEYLKNLLPYHDDPAYLTIEGELPFLSDDDFLEPLKYGYAPFAYESTIALGLAACQAYAVNESFTGVDHFNYFKNTTFEGVSGEVRFDPETGTRDPTSALYRVANYIEQEETDPGTGETAVRFVPVVSSLFQDGEWNEVVPYVFNDGTTDLPEDLPPPEVVEELNVALVIGVSIGLVIVMGVGVFLFYEHKRKLNDAVWKIKKDEILFAEVPEVIGRGSFGEVLLGEYRGTQVVVKRVKAEKTKRGGGVESADTLDSLPTNGTGDSSNGSRFAMKQITNIGFKSGYRSGNGSSSSQGKKRSEFLEEMRSLSKLRHPCVTTIMGAVMGKDPMIVMGECVSFCLVCVFNIDTVGSHGVDSFYSNRRVHGTWVSLRHPSQRDDADRG